MITTVIPLYNAERYLADALTSLVEQTCLPTRVVVLDNASTDNSLAIVGEFAHRLPLLSVRESPDNYGAMHNHNLALLECARSQYIHILHADDVIHPEFYQAALSGFIQNGITGRSLAYCDFNPRKNFSCPIFRRHWNHRCVIEPNAPFIVKRAQLGPTNPTCIVLKTDNRVPPCLFRKEFPFLADQYFFAEWASYCQKIVHIPEKLMYYRVHNESDTASHLRYDFPEWVCDELPVMQEIGRFLHHHWMFPRSRYIARNLVKMRLYPKRAGQILWMTLQTLVSCTLPQ